MQTPGPQAIHNGVDIWRPETDDSGSLQSEQLPKPDEENTYVINSDIVESSAKLVAASTREALEEIAQSYSTDNSDEHLNQEVEEYEDDFREGVEEEQEGEEEEEGERMSDAEKKQFLQNETESAEENSIREKIITSGAAEVLIESIDNQQTSNLPEKEEENGHADPDQQLKENENEEAKQVEEPKVDDKALGGSNIEPGKDQLNEESQSHEKRNPRDERQKSLEKHESIEKSNTENQSSEKIQEVDASSNNRRKRSLGEPEVNPETVDGKANVEGAIQSNYNSDEKSDINLSKMQTSEGKADEEVESATDLLAVPPVASLEAKSRKVALREEAASPSHKVDMNNNENTEDNRESEEERGEEGDDEAQFREEGEDATGEKGESVGSRKKWDRRGSLHPALPKIHKVDFGGETVNSVDGGSEESSPCASVIANDKMTDREELVISLKSGEKIRATTMIEVEGQEIDSVEYTKSATKSGRRKSKSLSKCNHRLHRKQSLTNVKPLDLKHVKAKVDTRPPDVFLRKR